MRAISIMILWICVSSMSVVSYASATPTIPTKTSTATSPAESALGRQVAKEIEKHCKLLQDDNTTAKLNAMAAELAPHTQRPDVVYSCKIIDSDEINAMSIPGGTIYFYKGLLKAVESDDELIGVMAHEMAHNALYHVMKMQAKNQRHSIAQMLSVIAAAIVLNSAHTDAQDSSKVYELLAMSQFVKEAVENGYSQEVEAQADFNGIQYIAATHKYNPLGLYSVILGFRQIEKSQGNQDTGGGDHPVPEMRARAMRNELTEMHVPINVWEVVNFRAVVIPLTSGTLGYTVKLGNIDICTFSAGDSVQDAQQRAQSAAASINARLTKADDRIQRIDVGTDVDTDGQRAQVTLRFTPVIMLIPADAKSAGITTLPDLAARVKERIQMAIFHESVKHGLSTSD